MSDPIPDLPERSDDPAAAAPAAPLPAQAMPQLQRFRTLLDDAPIVLSLASSSLEMAIESLVDELVSAGRIASEDRDAVLEAVLERERLQSTALGQGVAVPHGFLDRLDQPLLAVARLRRDIDCRAPDGLPVGIVFLIAGGRSDGDVHLEMLMSIARLQSDWQFRSEMDAATGRENVLAAVDSFIERSTPAAELPVRPDGLDASGPFNGVLGDIARRLPHLRSDLTDALSTKTPAAVLFLFFAQVAPTVAFGGLMAQLTGGQIGAMEMIVATAIGGVVYALFSGQPLTILGGTGPMLIFTGVLYELSAQLEVSFLGLYAWVGLWTGLLTVICALTNASSLIRYCTRFTDEIFAVLISVIFIYEAATNIGRVFQNESIDDYTALMSLVLAVSTFWVAVTLRNSRRSRYLRWWLRQFFADFGSVIAIAAATGIAVYLNVHGLPTLDVPESISTTSGRPWRVDLWSVPPWVITIALLPAMLSTVLVFLDQNITARLVNQPSHRLQKGAAYHLDLLIVGLLISFFSLLALPWLVAATVRSLNHVRALADVEEHVLGDGSTEERIVGVREQRVTGIAIHLLIALSVFFLPWLKVHGIEVPMAVLFGLFMFMGVTSVGGNQFFERLRLWVMDPHHYPRTSYVRRVPMRIIHQFTAIQLAGLVVLWVVKTSSLALLFPLFIGLLVPLRFALDRHFEQDHLELLDGEELHDELRGEASP